VRGPSEYLPAPKAIPVHVTLADGQALKGMLLVPMGKNVVEHINSTTPFLDFAEYNAERRYLGKSHIVSLRMDTPLTDQPVLPAFKHFNPYEILGIAPAADSTMIRQRYLKLAKQYHPDRFGGVELPTEVATYLSAMARRINAAYAAVQSEAEAGASPQASSA
jgi:hypothetical protein